MKLCEEREALITRSQTTAVFMEEPTEVCCVRSECL